MYGIEGIDELKDDPGDEEMTAPYTPPVDITKVSDEAGVRLAEEALLADVFGEVPPKDKIRFEDGDIGLERMAGEVHQVWASWMDYMFSKGLVLRDKGFKINPTEHRRWRRQASTPYDQLPEDEKQSDRDIARRYLNMAWFPPEEEPVAEMEGVDGYDRHSQESKIDGEEW